MLGLRRGREPAPSPAAGRLRRAPPASAARPLPELGRPRAPCPSSGGRARCGLREAGHRSPPPRPRPFRSAGSGRRRAARLPRVPARPRRSAGPLGGQAPPAGGTRGPGAESTHHDVRARSAERPKRRRPARPDAAPAAPARRAPGCRRPPPPDQSAAAQRREFGVCGAAPPADELSFEAAAGTAEQPQRLRAPILGRGDAAAASSHQTCSYAEVCPGGEHLLIRRGVCVCVQTKEGVRVCACVCAQTEGGRVQTKGVRVCVCVCLSCNAHALKGIRPRGQHPPV